MVRTILLSINLITSCLQMIGGGTHWSRSGNHKPNVDRITIKTNDAEIELKGEGYFEIQIENGKLYIISDVEDMTSKKRRQYIYIHLFKKYPPFLRTS